MPSLTKVQSGFMEAQGALPLSPGTAAAPGLKFDDHAGTGMFSPSTGEIAFSTSGHSQAVTFKTDGKVGISTIAPAEKLDVWGKIRASYGTDKYMHMYPVAGAGYFDVKNSTSYPSIIFRQIGSAGTQERLRIDSAGNIGINKDAPTSVLDVRQTNTGAATEIKLFNLDQSNATTQTAALVMTPDLRANGVKIVAVKEVADMSSTANKDLALTFQTVANNAAVERLRIDSAGNVKVLHDTQAYFNLTKNNGGGNGSLSFNGSTFAITSNSTGADMQLGTNSLPRITIKLGGNVGIGDIDPSDALTVYRSNVGNPTGITIRNTEASSTYSHARLRLESQNGAAYGHIWADIANSALRIAYNSSSSVYVKSNGDVGIGVNPEARLHVEENLSHSSTYYLNADAHILVDNPSTDATKKSVLKLEGEAAFVYGNGSGTLIFADRQHERLRITSAGNVGIGTDNPGQKLTVKGTTSLMATNSTNNWMAYTFTDNTFRLNYNGSGADEITITSDGNIGINCTPSANDLASGASFGIPKLHVLGNNSQSGAYEFIAKFQSGTDADNTGSTIVLNHSNDRGLAIQGGRSVGNRSFGALKSIDNQGRLTNVMAFSGENGQGVQYISFYTGNSTSTTSRLHIDSDGKVGIGTDNPTETLYVNGTVRLGGGVSYGSATVLSVAPGAIQWDKPSVAGGRLHATSSDNWYLNGKSYPIYTSKGVDMNEVYACSTAASVNQGNWVLLGNTQDGAPYHRKAYKISVPDSSSGTFVYQVWFNGDANYEHGGLYEIRINNWSESTRFTSVAITCINGVSTGLRVYAYNTSEGIWITTNSIWGSLYIRKFGYDDARRSRGSTLCAVDNNGYLAQADVGGVAGTIPSGYTEVHASDSGGGGYDIENNHRFGTGSNA